MEGMAFLNAHNVFGRHEPVGLIRTFKARRSVSSLGSIVPRRLLALRTVIVDVIGMDVVDVFKGARRVSV